MDKDYPLESTFDLLIHSAFHQVFWQSFELFSRSEDLNLDLGYLTYSLEFLVEHRARILIATAKLK